MIRAPAQVDDNFEEYFRDTWCVRYSDYVLCLPRRFASRHAYLRIFVVIFILTK